MMPIPMRREHVKAYIVFAIGFLILGIFGALIGDFSATIGLLLISLFWLLISLFYLTKERKESVRLKETARGLGLG
jgi:cbb3-type cytochrome oxidase subunit 3